MIRHTFTLFKRKGIVNVDLHPKLMHYSPCFALNFDPRINHWLWQQAPRFSSLVELNEWLLKHCQELWQTLPHPQDKQRTIAEV